MVNLGQLMVKLVEDQEKSKLLLASYTALETQDERRDEKEGWN